MEEAGSWQLVTNRVRARGSLRSKSLVFFLSLTGEASSSVSFLEVFHCELRIKSTCSFKTIDKVEIASDILPLLSDRWGWQFQPNIFCHFVGLARVFIVHVVFMSSPSFPAVMVGRWG